VERGWKFGDMSLGIEIDFSPFGIAFHETIGDAFEFGGNML